MRTCAFDGVFSTEPRSHPWTDAASDAACVYYDLKATPARIRTSLEDLVPWARYAAVDALYGLLEWLNGPRSPLESNDCAFSGPHDNDSREIEAALGCSGRVMVLFRDLARNVAEVEVMRLENDLHRALGSLDPGLAWGMVGTTRVPVRYLDLPAGQQLGQQLMISFWSWGDSEAEVMKNLARVIACLSKALEAS